MKSKCFFLFLMLSQVAIADPSVITAPVKHIYVPSGFDSNDAVEVIVTGQFPNPCFSRNDVKVKVKDDRISVSITALNSSGEKRFCPAMIVPFKEVVSIGNLQGGDYKITVNNKLTDELKVIEADSNAVDDHIYAAIDNLEKKGSNSFVLHGWRYSPCITLDKIDIISNGKDTLSVLPIMKQVSDFCPMKFTPVAYAVELNTASLKSKEPLVHVRTMDGKSFNSLLNSEKR